MTRDRHSLAIQCGLVGIVFIFSASLPAATITVGGDCTLGDAIDCRDRGLGLFKHERVTWTVAGTAE